MKKFITLCALVSTIIFSSNAQTQVWVADNGDGTYTNPILHADYSDPDVIRVGEDYYMVSSSFNCAPGIPILHSKDLVNWKLINHAYDSLPYDQYTRVAHGRGSWAPSIRHHNGTFYIYFCTPDDGLFVSTAKDPKGKWTLHHVLNVAQWEDPCPFWDDNGDAWLIRSKLCGGPVYLHRMSDDGLKLLDNGRVVYWDQKENPILEGVKMHKRNGYYYILAPAGGVTNGWQTALRSKNIEGPYEARRILDEGNGINGPHQGGLVDTPSGEWWFIHFQDKGVYGRITHLQPARWSDDDWVVVGDDKDGDGCGVPVLSHRKPDTKNNSSIITPQTSDEFTSRELELQWQWQGTPKDEWYDLDRKNGRLRLYPISAPTEMGNLHYAANLLLQKLPAPSFEATTKVCIDKLSEGARAGLTVMGSQHSYLTLEKYNGGVKIVLYSGKYDNCGFPPYKELEIATNKSTIYLKTTISADGTYFYSYSENEIDFIDLQGKQFNLSKGRWIGAKFGLFCINPDVNNGCGYAEFDYLRVRELK